MSHQMDVPHLVYLLLADGHLYGFHILVITNTASANVHPQIFTGICVCSITLSTHLGMAFLGCLVTAFDSVRMTHSVSKGSPPLYIST